MDNINLSRQFGELIEDATKGALTPYILEKSQDRLAQLDVFSRLMKNRILYFGDSVNQETSGIMTCQLLYLYSVSKDPITMYINSPGGEVYSGLAVYDTMDLIKQSGVVIKTVATGYACSMGSILMQGGTRGYRSALKHSRIMIHQVSTGTGRVTNRDLQVTAKETDTLNEELMEILSNSSGKPLDEVKMDCLRDCWIKAQEALPGKYGKHGLIDEIITSLV